MSASGRRVRGLWPKRVLLGALIALASVNLFTGAPLFALWVGSRIEGGGSLTMGVLGAVVATLAVALAALTKALLVLGRTYDSLTGHQPGPRQRAVWLRSMRDERLDAKTRASELTVLEKALVATVVLAVLAFELWFFFFAGSSLPRAS